METKGKGRQQVGELEARVRQERRYRSGEGKYKGDRER